MEGDNPSPTIEEEEKVNPEELTKRKSAIIKKINNCSYPRGYITQQVFACKTCYDEKRQDSDDKELNQYGEKVEPAGFCIACLVNCHNGHTAYELYSKTNFRCDCGNLKLNQQCLLYDEKDMYNEHNKYSHNFFGKYCYCSEEYNGDVPMIQCILCEDWFHFYHMNPNSTEKFNKLEENEVYCLLICRNCASKNLDWLSKKTDLILNYDEILNLKNSQLPKPVEDTESSEEIKSSIEKNERKRTREEIEEEREEPHDQVNEEKSDKPTNSNENIANAQKLISQSECNENKRQKIADDESELKDIINIAKPCTFLNAEKKSIEGCDLLMKEEFYDSLCSCENKECEDYRKEILKLFKRVDGCSQEEAHLDEALLDDLLGLEEDELESLLHQTGSNHTNTPAKNEDSIAKSQENNDLFSDLVTQNYPNI